MRRNDNDTGLRQQTVGRFLRTKRLAVGLTQWDVARALAYTTAQFVSNWERGVSLPPVTVLAKLAKILRLDPNELVDVLITYQEKSLRLYRKKLASAVRLKA
jgi:transcriptional regulator with XRE-family HTH domain